MRAITKWLLLAFAAGTPVVGFACLDINGVGCIRSANGIAHYWFLRKVFEQFVIDVGQFSVVENPHESNLKWYRYMSAVSLQVLLSVLIWIVATGGLARTLEGKSSTPAL